MHLGKSNAGYRGSKLSFKILLAKVIQLHMSSIARWSVFYF